MPSKYTKRGNRNYTKNCVVCEKEFKGTHGQFACSKECADSRIGTSLFAGLDTGKIGAIGELRVSADLLMKGFEVYRTMSQSSSADLIAYREGKTTRIEVKTGRKRLSIDGCVCPVSGFRADVLAVVLSDKITYFSKEMVSGCSTGSFLIADGTDDIL